MIKKTIKYLLYFLILITIGVIYLSYFGIETKRFNQLIRDKISDTTKKIDIELQEVKIVLNLNNFSIALKTYDSDIIFKDKKIKLKKIGTNFSIKSFFQKEFAIKNVLITTKENNFKDIISLARIYQNTPQLFIFNKMVKEGVVIADIVLNFDDKGELTKSYNIKGSVKDGKIKLFNKKNINNISFNFNIKDKQYLLESSQIEYEKLKLSSKKIEVSNKEQYFLFAGDVSIPKNLIDSNLLAVIFKNNLENIGINNVNFGSENNFSFRLEKKFKISNFKIDTKIDLQKLTYKKKTKLLRAIIPNYNDSIELIDHKIELFLSKNKLSIKGKGNFSIDEKINKINYEIKFNDDKYNFKSNVELNNIPLQIKILNYTKKENKNSLLNIEGFYKKNQNIYFKNILLKESENNFKISGLNLNQNYKINYIEEVNLDFLNDSKKENKILLKKNKENYKLSGKIFDGTILLDKILESDSEGNVFNILNDFNSVVKVSLNKIFIDDTSYLKNLNGSLKFNKSNLKNLDLKANFSDNKRLTFTLKTDQNNQKITTLFSEHAKPFVKKYKFIKGFEEGYLDFYSVKKNNISNSNLKINDFKLKEVPALTKILTLASLQGIADLLTGEGIRFNEFEMKFRNEKKLMTIDEIYAIGPAISIMMDGYVQNDKLISLRGTLVPATTLNKFIGSLPLLGDILVGKKTGEGVFGVSFKIKGPPKKTKTTVNPIKTLTPRFITRTLEKIKKN
jgi:hypothetical protein